MLRLLLDTIWYELTSCVAPQARYRGCPSGQRATSRFSSEVSGELDIHVSLSIVDNEVGSTDRQWEISKADADSPEGKSAFHYIVLPL